jgi:type IV pilus assembly protein PilY1
MLHAFDDSDGRELWGFIPPNLLNKLQALHADVIENYVDGSPRAFLTYDSDGDITQAILIFGERRGGNRYYALDVTDPDSPQFLWEINSAQRVFQITITNTTDYQRIGQTWAAPMVGKIACQEGSSHCVNVSPTTHVGERWVTFLGGGFDTNHDNDPVTLPDTMGTAVFVVDVLDGTLVKRFSNAEIADMTNAIPSDVTRVDTDGNGKVDRLYVGDLGGRMWRFDLCDPNPSDPTPCTPDPANWTAKIIFKANPGASDRRKIFYPPDVTLERDTTGDYERLFFGTGDREAPKETTVINRLYSVKDKFTVSEGVYTPSSPLEETDLLNVTAGDPDITELRTKSGWYITLENTGEKSLANPVVFYKIAYFTTFTPTGEVIEGDPCYVGEGDARLYAVRYDTGNAVFANFDLTGDPSGTILTKSDRSIVMGTAIPSGVIITFIGGKAVAYAGVGGGVFAPQLGDTSPLVPMTWRIVF